MAPPIRRLPVLERIYGSSWSTALALALVVGSVLFLVVFPRLASRRIESLRKDMLEIAVPAHQAAGNIERAVALEVAAVRGYLLSGGPQFRTRFREASADEARAAAELQALARQLGGDVPDRVAAFERLKAGWREPIAALMDDGISREEYLRDLVSQQARFEAIVAALQQVDAAIMAAEDGRRAAIAEAEAAEDRWMVLASIVAVLSAVVAGTIARRLRVLTRRAVASEEQFRAVAETAQVAIFVVAQDDTIVFANRPVERIFGYTAAELIGKPLVTLIPAELRRNHRAGVERYVATGERRLSWEGVDLPAMSKDGREVPIELTLGEFFRDGRRYFTAIARDITERRRAEQEKAGLLLREREARERAEAAIRTREEVLAIVSHDLRNPLNTIAMGAAALKDFAADEATRERYVQMIQRAIQRMNRLIEDLLDVVRLEGGQKLALDLAPLELAPVLTELAESFRAQAEPRQQAFVCELEPGLPTVTADRHRLAQVVSNLVGNALKFTPEGGRVELRAARVGEEVQVSVRDDGPGMTDEERGRIFDPYWQAGRTARLGAGLGLTISKGIVESHGGRLIVDSTPGKGSTFTFTLPVASAGAETPVPETEGAAAPTGSGSG